MNRHARFPVRKFPFPWFHTPLPTQPVPAGSQRVAIGSTRLSTRRLPRLPDAIGSGLYIAHSTPHFPAKVVSSCSVGARSDFRIVGQKEFLISGTITERDANAFQQLSAELERDDFNVQLDSPGGDVLAAMEIGRLIRKYDGFTKILWWRKCYSSCALIFIAGVQRFISRGFSAPDTPTGFTDGGQLGLHRPYLASTPQNRQTVEMQVPVMLAQVKQYVSEMGITDNFYQEMVNTEPSQMAVYKGYSKLVPKYDPVYQEVEVAYRARSYGVTTSEMRRREIAAEACKKDEFDDDDCGELILWGLSERLYRERFNKTRSCWIDDDTNFLQALPKKVRRDHPLWIKRETCIRNIMLGRS
jgi:hypothetical protein